MAKEEEEIVVRYASDVLGEGEFWRGPKERMHEIRNIAAVFAVWRLLRAEDGAKSAREGMWIASFEEATP